MWKEGWVPYERKRKDGWKVIVCVAESPSLARFQGACLPLGTKSPESELNQMIPSSTPDGRTRTLHILHSGSNNEYKLTILSPFHTTQSLETVITIPEVQSAIINSGNKITSNGSDENPYVPIRRILHTRQTCSKCTYNRGKNKSWVHNVLARLTRLGIIFPDSQGSWLALWLMGFLYAESSTKSVSLIS
jgi:hypothetical protein